QGLHSWIEPVYGCSSGSSKFQGPHSAWNRWFLDWDSVFFKAITHLKGRLRLEDRTREKNFDPAMCLDNEIESVSVTESQRALVFFEPRYEHVEFVLIDSIGTHDAERCGFGRNVFRWKEPDLVETGKKLFSNLGIFQCLRWYQEGLFQHLDDFHFAKDVRIF